MAVGRSRGLEADPPENVRVRDPSMSPEKGRRRPNAYGRPARRGHLVGLSLHSRGCGGRCREHVSCEPNVQRECGQVQQSHSAGIGCMPGLRPRCFDLGQGNYRRERTQGNAQEPPNPCERTNSLSSSARPMRALLFKYRRVQIARSHSDRVN